MVGGSPPRVWPEEEEEEGKGDEEEEERLLLSLLLFFLFFFGFDDCSQGSKVASPHFSCYNHNADTWIMHLPIL